MVERRKSNRQAKDKNKTNKLNYLNLSIEKTYLYYCKKNKT